MSQTGNFSTPLLTENQTIMAAQNITSRNTLITWNSYLEFSIVTVGCLVGILGNALVIKTACKVETPFARQIMTLFFALAVSDGIISGVRIPLFIYGNIVPSAKLSTEFCLMWNALSAIFQITIWEHFLVSFQRFMIMYSFPIYKKYFSVKFTILIVIPLWLFYWFIYIALPWLSHINMAFKSAYFCQDMPYAQSTSDRLLIKIMTIGILGFLPILLTVLCHIWIVMSIIRAGLTHLDGIEESAFFVRINTTSISRIVFLFLLILPYLLLNFLDPGMSYYSHTAFHWTEYLLCLHSIISPYLTLCDSDFKESSTFRKSKSNRLRSAGSLRRSRKLAASNITSGELRTNKNTVTE